jgi:hypothetical protein
MERSFALMKEDKEGQPVATTTEARQGERKGVIWVLIGGLSLAAIVGAAFLYFFGT